MQLPIALLGDIDLLLVGITKLQLLATIVRVAYLILLPIGIGSGEPYIKYLYGITENW